MFHSTSPFGFNAIVVQIQAVALGWFVYAQTNSAFSLGLIGLAQFLPALPTLAFAGYAADHYDRRKVIIAGQAFQAASYVGLFATIWFLPRVTLLIYVFVLLISSARQISAPSMLALLTSAVPRDQLPRAIAISSAAQQVATIIGPAVGGLGYAVIGKHFRHAGVFPLISMFIMFMLQTPTNVTDSQDGGSPLQRTLAGFGYIRSNPLLFGLILLDLFAVLFGGVAALLPVFARDVLQVGPSGLGLLNAAPAAGGVLLGFALAYFRLKRHIGPIMQLSVAGYGVAIVVFGLSTNFILSLAALAATGAFDTISMVIRHTVLQTATPNAMRGRVSAINSVFTGASEVRSAISRAELLRD